MVAEGTLGREQAVRRERAQMQSVVLVGTSFRTARIEVRELVATRLSKIPEPGDQVGSGQVFESAVLETCNRLEVYLACSSPADVARRVLTMLDGSGALQGSFYVKTGTDALEHVFRVAAGLDSPVLGEEQILEQVRDAGKTARARGHAKSILSSLFDAAYSSGKRVRESYHVSPANRSVSVFALRRALAALGRRPSKVLLIGSGETAKLAALKLKGSTVYLLSSRRGVETRFPNAVRISRKRLRETVARCDLIIAATRRRGYVLAKKDLPSRKKTVILDLGFPRNVDPGIKASQNVRLFDLDAVAEWAHSKGPHGDEAAEMLVRTEARRFDSWLTASRLTPTLGNIYRWADRIREEETLAALRKLPGLSEHDRTVVESLSRRLTGKLLSPHVSFIKDVRSEEDQGERLRLLESIFNEGK
ncbi:MAG: glutamyl-tRNA reductase [Nitrososphaerota archaeon]|nr:glutamyl-tRNA reductase [Nitrososphaerota archaeon]MDG7023891.1 glutamyl-tRNA reductase [Nitrososphaerota archaeon]